jgi:hypothetical protein
MVYHMKVTVNDIPVDLDEREIFKLSQTEAINIPLEEGIFCLCCGCPVRFRCKSPTQMAGLCVNCNRVNMRHRSGGSVSWEDAGVVVFDEKNRRKPVYARDQIKTA